MTTRTTYPTTHCKAMDEIISLDNSLRFSAPISFKDSCMLVETEEYEQVSEVVEQIKGMTIIIDAQSG